jgi:teichuronic acid biosynthesis protein TuaE
MVLAVALTVALTAFVARGHAPLLHAAVALAVPVIAGLALLLVATRRRLARVRVGRLLVIGLIALPGLAVIGPAVALPHARQLFAARVLTALVGYGGLIWLILTRRRLRFEAATFVWLYVAWLCWLLITVAWAPYPGSAPHYLFQFVSLGAIGFATACAGLTRRRLVWLVRLLGAVYGLSLLIGLAEWRLHVHLPSASPTYAHHGKTAGYFFNTNDFGTYLAFCWPFVLLLPGLLRRRRVLVLTVLTLLVTLFVLRYTTSRTSVIAIGLETVVVGLAVARRSGRRARTAATVLVVIVLIGVALALTGRFGSALSATNLVSQVRSGQGSGGVRTELQTAGLRAGSTRLFLGVGPGNAEPLVAAENPTFTIFNLHDWWLEVFVDGGLPALLIFLTMFLLLLRAMVRVERYARDPLVRYLGAATAVALVGFPIAIVGPSTAILFPPLAVILGLAVAVLIRARRDDAAAALVAATSPSAGPAPDLLDSGAVPAGGVLRCAPQALPPANGRPEGAGAS